MQVKMQLVEIDADGDEDGGFHLRFYVESAEEARAFACQYFRTIVVDIPGPQPASVYPVTTEEG